MAVTPAILLAPSVPILHLRSYRSRLISVLLRIRSGNPRQRAPRLLSVALVIAFSTLRPALISVLRGRPSLSSALLVVTVRIVLSAVVTLGALITLRVIRAPKTIVLAHSSCSLTNQSSVL